MIQEPWHKEFLNRFLNTQGPAIWVVDGLSGCAHSEKLISRIIREDVVVVTSTHRRRSQYEERTRIWTQHEFPSLHGCNLLIIDEYDRFKFEPFRLEFHINCILEQNGIVLFFGQLYADCDIIWWVHKKATYTFHVPERVYTPWFTDERRKQLKLLFEK